MKIEKPDKKKKAPNLNSNLDKKIKERLFIHKPAVGGEGLNSPPGRRGKRPSPAPKG